MAQVIVMPQLGRITSEAVIREWMVQVGEDVEVGQLLCEIETDKAEVEYESPFGGQILARLDSDVRVPVGEPIAIVGEEGEDMSGLPELYTPSRGPEEDVVARVSQVTESPPPSSIAAVVSAVSPVARRLAAELGVDLTGVVGSGPRGRVTRADVLAASDQSSDRVVKASQMWVAIAETMSRSASIPQFALERDLVLPKLRIALDEWRAQSDDASRPTLGDAVIGAVGRAIRVVPGFLRSYRERGFFDLHRSINIGIAVATPDGLIVPVLRDADSADVTRIAGARRAMQARAQKGELADSDLADATFTVSNLGPLGVHRFRPLINPPESGIVGVGAPSPGARDILTITLVADHRVVNGADGAALLEDIAARLESDDGLASLAPPS